MGLYKRVIKMGTPCCIGIKQGDDIKYVFVSYDGYLSGTGRILKMYWNSSELADKLISGGDMANVGKSTDECNYFPPDKTTSPCMCNIRRFFSLTKNIRAYVYDDSWKTVLINTDAVLFSDRYYLGEYYENNKV